MDKIPELSRQTIVVVLTADERVEIGLTALRLGARAIVQKRFAIETLLTAIQAVVDGLVWMPPAMQAALVGQDGPAAKGLPARIRNSALRGSRNAQRRENISGAAVTQRAQSKLI